MYHQPGPQRRGHRRLPAGHRPRPQVRLPAQRAGQRVQPGRYDEAIAAYQQAIALDPKYAYPHNGLGNVYRETGPLREAIAAYQQAIALDPKDAPVNSFNGKSIVGSAMTRRITSTNSAGAAADRQGG